ncbi:MAG: PHP domain-containing protein [Deltaproteobacteria bacterium]|nr:PHP domain-containing protein [Deltaproteobacteria bacterium]
MYVTLWCKSYYSFLEGVSSPSLLMSYTRELRLPALALTDRDGVYGAVQAHVAACEHGIRLIIGSQVTINDGYHIVLLAQSRKRYANLCRLITIGRRRFKKGKSAITWQNVCEGAQDAFALRGGGDSAIEGAKSSQGCVWSLYDASGDRLYCIVTRPRRDDERK